MDKKPKKEQEIPRPEKDVKIEKTDPKFNAALSSFLKKHTKKPKSNDDTGNK
jgi:hypothetical protein